MVKNQLILKKIGLIMTLLLISIMGVHAVTTLNSCGNSVWTNGETYILNFSLIDNTYGNDYCFIFNNQNYNSITFQPTSQINISKTGNFYFFYAVDGTFGNSGLNNNLDNFTLNNMNLRDISNSGNKYMFRTLTGGGTEHYFFYNNFKMDNVTIKDFYALGYFQLGYIANSQISNSFFDMKYLADGLNNGVAVGVLSNTINDSLLILRNGYEINIAYNDNNAINRSVLIVSDYNTASHTNIVQSSLIKGYLHNDTNDNNIADTNAYTTLISMNIYVDLFNYRFIQNFAEGNPFIEQNKTLVPINDETLSSFAFQFNEQTLDTYDFGLVNYQTDNIQVFTPNAVNTFQCAIFGGFNKTSLLGGKCIIQEVNPLSSGAKYKGVFGAFSQTNYIGLKMLKTSSSNINFISNDFDLVRTSINIKDNWFYRSDEINATSNIDTSTELIKLKVNDLDISNNTFQLNVNTQISNYELISIENTNRNNNLIYLNNFTSSNSTARANIFTTKCDALFYNNYVSNYINITSNCVGLNATPLIGYLHTNGNIYYYYVGNYYQNNSACVDGDADGFCDSSFTSGNIIDTNPLSSYPFIFTSHLLTAESVVVNGAFNITLQTPTDNQNFTIPTTSTPINFSFSQDSAFIDLTCDYIIDGISVAQQLNPTQNTIYDESFNGWANQSYTYRVECGNEFQYIISNEITFNVVVSSEAPPVEEGNETSIIPSFSIGASDLFSTDTQTSSNAVLGLFELLDRPFGFLLIVGFILLFLGILALIFGGLMYLIR